MIQVWRYDGQLMTPLFHIRCSETVRPHFNSRTADSLKEGLSSVVTEYFILIPNNLEGSKPGKFLGVFAKFYPDTLNDS